MVVFESIKGGNEMPFNTENDYTKPPYTNGIMTLTNDECLYVIEKCEEVAAAYKPEEPWEGPKPDKIYIISNYNRIDNWQKAINGDTYDCLQGYDPTVNTQGINENGIIPEPSQNNPQPPTDDTDTTEPASLDNSQKTQGEEA